MSDPLEVVAARITMLALNELPGKERERVVSGRQPVITVARDTMSGQLSVGLNKDLSEGSKELPDVLYKAILEQKGRIWKGEVTVVRTDPSAAAGGHSEIDALNPLIRAREKVLGRKLTEKDLGVFELHNVWLRGDRAGKTAPRCEHCARITRGVSVTQAVFVAEGGVVGEGKVHQRGAVLPAGRHNAKPVTTTGEGEVNVAQRGSVTPAGGGASKPVTTTTGSIGGRGSGVGGVGGAVRGVVTAAAVLARPIVMKWFRENFLEEKVLASVQTVITTAIDKSIPAFDLLITTHMVEIYKAKAAGRDAKLRIDVDVEWNDTELGPAPFRAEVAYYNLVLDGGTGPEWPLFQDHPGFIKDLIRASRITRTRHTFYLPL